ncbi:hypothetical protein Ocin01_16615 [Orchesella cincta]|uniref:F-box domain-containing protein n=1 Tax=Orchesella cincta TaxID=48709 RepID=A0A1D2MAP8_ORCCI|nr:hypothetical protein Ocin01_16615 [Orchesella cincta]
MEPKTIFSLFPEIWEFHILPHVSPIDYHTIINSCPTWRDMLRKKTANGLLPLVLPILMKHKSVTPQSFLAWRGVSHAAKSLVDGILEEFVSSQEYFNSVSTVGAEWSPTVIDEEHHLRNVLVNINNRYDLRQIRNLRNFMAFQLQAASTGIASSDLLLTKSVQLNILERRFGEYHDRPMDFLSRSGLSISTVTFNVLRGDSSLVLRFLSFVPNVKVFCLKGDHVIGAQVARLPQQGVQLNQLQLLDVSNFRNPYGLPLYSHLLKYYCSQISTLICNGELFENYEDASAIFNKNTLPNLRHLRVKIDPFSTAPQIFINALPRLGSLPLQVIQLVQRSRNILLSMWDVVHIMDAFSETLTHFLLFLDPRDASHRETVDVNQRHGIPTMPKLTKFSVSRSATHHPWFWTMLRLKCQLLEELNIHGTAYMSKYSMNELQQNLFGSIPTLQKISFHSGFSDEGGTPYRIVFTSDGKEKRIQFSRHKED